MTSNDLSTWIRPAGALDVSVLTSIIRESFLDVARRFQLTEQNCPKHPSNCREQWIRDAMEKGIRYFILEIEGRSCGCVALEQANTEVCYLERLAVLPDHRRKGYGRALVDKMIVEAKTLGVQRIEIGIIAEQTELKEWYERIGFQEIRRAVFSHIPFEVAFMFLKIP